MSTIAEPSAGLSPRRRDLLRLLGIHVLVCFVVGVIAGIIWISVVRLPAWAVHESGRARISERDLAAYFSVDAWFVLLAAVGGLVIGVASLLWFRQLGWWASLITLLGALIAAGGCLLVGWISGPGQLDARLAAAQPGSRVPIDFVLSSPSAVAVWPFAAMIPLLVGASLLPDPEERSLSTDEPAVEDAQVDSAS